MTELSTIYDTPDGVTITTINIGNTDKQRADIIKERLNGKTYMDFQVICAPDMGSYHVSAQTVHNAPPDEIMGVLLFAVATELYELSRERPITAAIRTLTARVSDAETTATPTAALELSEARRHLLRASAAVERAQEDKAWKDVADDLIAEAQAEREG